MSKLSRCFVTALVMISYSKWVMLTNEPWTHVKNITAAALHHCGIKFLDSSWQKDDE